MLDNKGSEVEGQNYGCWNIVIDEGQDAVVAPGIAIYVSKFILFVE